MRIRSPGETDSCIRRPFLLLLENTKAHAEHSTASVHHCCPLPLLLMLFLAAYFLQDFVHAVRGSLVYWSQGMSVSWILRVAG